MPGSLLILFLCSHEEVLFLNPVKRNHNMNAQAVKGNGSLTCKAPLTAFQRDHVILRLRIKGNYTRNNRGLILWAYML